MIKRLYRFNQVGKNLETHDLGEACTPVPAPRYDFDAEEIKTILVCPHYQRNFYGFASLREARKEAVARTLKEIDELHEWLWQIEYGKKRALEKMFPREKENHTHDQAR